ncbi:hypothetical protein pb186bvf_007466 [Paramecium bursaria]
MSEDEQQENQDQQEQQQELEPEPQPNDSVLDPNVFLTQQKLEGDVPWKSYDFLFPGGKLAKLIRVNYQSPKTFPFSDILNKLKLNDGYPYPNEQGRGKFYAGIARACHNTDAIIVDNGINSGIERFSIRRNCTLFGVAPESSISYPKLNPTKIDPNELSNGHTHLFLLQDEQKQDQKQKQNKQQSQFGSEAQFKINLCRRLAQGKKNKEEGRPPCKIVNVLFADTNECFQEIREAIIYKQPIIVVRGSLLCNQFIDKQNDESVQITDREFDDIMSDVDAHFFPLDSLNSELIAQLVHYLLTFTPAKKRKE